MKNVFCFGDSLTRGSWDSQGGWCGRLRQELDKKFIETKDQKYFQNVFNLGVSSRPLEDMLARFDNETTARTREDADNIFVFQVGMVNASYDAKTNKPMTSDVEWPVLLKQLNDKANKFGGKILFIGLPPVIEPDANSANRIAKLGRKYFNKRITEIDGITTKFCREQGLQKVEINQELLSLDYASMCFDGIHPNDSGHEWIYQKMRGPFLNFFESR